MAGPIIGAFFCIALAALWAFLKFLPRHDDRKPLDIYNYMTIALSAALGIVWYYNFSSYFKTIGLEKHVPLVAGGGGLMLFSALLGIFLLLRNFWMFKEKHYRPGKF
jgi:hypothetical protein